VDSPPVSSHLSSINACRGGPPAHGRNSIVEGSQAGAASAGLSAVGQVRISRNSEKVAPRPAVGQNGHPGAPAAGSTSALAGSVGGGDEREFAPQEPTTAAIETMNAAGRCT
jgi:hypothetical protein